MASDDNLKVETVADLQRGKPKPPVSAAALDAIFRTAKGAAGTAEGDTAGHAASCSCVTDVIDPTARRRNRAEASADRRDR